MSASEQIEAFIAHLRDVKKSSLNTQVSYRRDLNKAISYFREKGIEDTSFIDAKALDAYMQKLQEDKLSAATISRNAAALRSFFSYLKGSGQIDEVPSSDIHAPQVEKKAPDILSVEEVEQLLDRPNRQTMKGIRDAAMLEILYGTGIRVTELINLHVSDVDLDRSCLTCRDGSKKRLIPFGISAKQAVRIYLDHSRPYFTGDSDSTFLFTNVSGGSMSRQGFWKLLKGYAADAGISSNITPHTLRHSFSAHLIANGADEKLVGAMLGHADAAPVDLRKLRSAYKKNHPRR